MSDELGSITAVLKIDASQWFQELEAAKAAAEELRTVDPTVRVQTDTGRAIADLTGLQAEIDRLKAESAAIKVTADTGRARTDLAALQAVVHRVAADSAAIRVKVDGTAQAVAELTAVRAAADRAGQSDGLRRIGSSARDAGGQVNWLAAGILGLGPALVPLAGAAVGVTAALGAMGGVGILAVLGIRREMQQGTADGQKYTALIGTLRGNLTQLEATAAHATLPGVTTAVATLQRFMPGLNQQTQFFGQRLGQITSTGVSAVLTMFTRLQPVMRLGADYLLQFVRNLDGFAHSNGFTSFVQYAVSNMPRLTQLLNSTFVLAGRILQAFAPWGSVVLGAVQGVVNALNALPLPVLQAVASGIGAIVLYSNGLKLVPAVVEAISSAFGGLGAAVDVALGPVGLIVGTVTLLGAAFMSVTQQERDVAAATQDYTTQLESLNSVSADALRGQVAQKAIQAGLITQGQQLGISARTTVDAMLGSRDATRQVVDALNAHIAAAGQDAGAQAHAKLETDNYRNAVANTQQAVGGAVQQAKQYKAAMDQTGSSSRTAGSDMQTAAAAAADLASKLNQAMTAALAYSGSEAGATLATDSAITALKAAAKAATNHKVSLDASTVAGAKNVQQVDQAVGAYQSVAAAMVKSGSSQEAANKYVQDSAVAFGKQMVAAGASKTQVANLLSNLLQLPKSVITKLLADDTNAKQKTDQAKKSAQDFANHPYTGKLGADAAGALSKAAAAKKAADLYAKTNYQALLKAQNTDAISKAEAARKKGQEFSAANYLAFLKANNADAEAKTNAAKTAAKAFAAAQYQAYLKANPNPANASTAEARARATAFKNAFYQAILRGDPNPAKAAVRAAQAVVDGFHGKTVTIRVDEVIRTSPLTVGRLASGGTVHGLAAGGTAAAMYATARRAAAGVTAGYSGTVYGPGTAFDDLAGLFRLANGEEVTSNMRGQADRWRPTLKAINAGASPAGVVRTAAANAGMGAGAAQAPTTVIYRTVHVDGPHIHHPVAQDPVQAAQAASQYLLAYSGL